ncbi:hypothetical protein D915_000429 [Fasciola hepatica]|uniref:Uncharacterized protein n=1 Tax=Fasciola hepatica TaxID=6192 RepID=A0A4E0RL89_FASHE|nr:hypothetical protein D915_000429 [Fasciola hepatica]
MPSEKNIIKEADLILRYILPLGTIATLHTVVIRKIQQIGKNHNPNLHQAAYDENATGENPNESHSHSCVWKIMSISTFGFTAEMTFLKVIAFVLYSLQTSGLVNFRVDSDERFYYVFKCSLTHGMNPVLEIATIPPLRKTIVQMGKDYWKFIRDVM